MNELQHHATATLAVLNRVQIGLERIRAGNGSAALLPTLADQLRDAVKIIEIAQSAPQLISQLDEESLGELISRGTKTSCRDALNTKPLDTCDDDDTAALLARCQEAQDEADKATSELKDALQAHRLNTLADQLSAELGLCGLARPALLDWLADQVQQLKQANVGDSAAATAMIDAAYLALLTGRNSTS